MPSRPPGSATPKAQDDDIGEREIQRQGPSTRPSVLDHDRRDGSLWWAMKYALSIPTNRLLIIASAVGYLFFSGSRAWRRHSAGPLRSR